MKKKLPGFLAVGLFLLFQTTTAQAEIRFIKTQGGAVTICDTKAACASVAGTRLPVMKGATATYRIVGPWVDRHTNLSVSGTGVRPRATSGRAINIGGEDVGEIEIAFDVSTEATQGERTVSINYAFGGLGSDTFKIDVVGTGKVTRVDLPSLTTFFQNVEVTLKGENLGNAKVVAFLLSADGNSRDNNAVAEEVITNTSDRIVIKLTFTERRAEATVAIQLYNKLLGGHYQGLSNDETIIELVGPNAVKSVSFPIAGRCGNGCFKVGDVFTVQIDLVRKASQPRTPLVGTVTTTRTLPGSASLLPPGGEVITYLVVPPANFIQASSQAPYNSNGSFNTVRIAPGDTSTRFDLKVGSCPGSGQQNQVTIETWTGGNTNTREAPVFKQQSFAIDCRP